MYSESSPFNVHLSQNNFIKISTLVQHNADRYISQFKTNEIGAESN